MQLANLWPALLGSLSLRRSRCIRENCRACLSGEQHRSFVLYGRANGRRVAVYVPEELVAEVQRAWTTGGLCRICCTKRRREYQGAEASARRSCEERRGLRVSRTTKRQVSFADWELVRQDLRLEPLLQAISDFLTTRRTSSNRSAAINAGLKKAETGRSGLTPQQILSLAGSDAHQELELSRITRADCRRLHTAPVHGLLLSASALTRCVPPRLQTAHARDVKAINDLVVQTAVELQTRKRPKAACRHHGGADRHSSSDRTIRCCGMSFASSRA